MALTKVPEHHALCSYAPARLAYTYFHTPDPPAADELNAIQSDLYFFTIDDELVYLSFYQDTGPLNAACLYRFCLTLHSLLEDTSLKDRKIVLYSSNAPDKKANAAMLVALYALLVLRWQPMDVMHPIAGLELLPFRDAGYSLPTFPLHPISLIYGLSKALQHNLVDFSKFDLEHYELHERVEEGDWNWITGGFGATSISTTPGTENGDAASEASSSAATSDEEEEDEKATTGKRRKNKSGSPVATKKPKPSTSKAHAPLKSRGGILAFASPNQTVSSSASTSSYTHPPEIDGVQTFHTLDASGQTSVGPAPEVSDDGEQKLPKAFQEVLKEFRDKKVGKVVRLNKKLYDKRWFENSGIDVVEMYFDDGTNPTLSMTRQFINLTEETLEQGKSLAVHCKAGLGRTGTLIGAYLIWKYGFGASEVIAFMRLMRPGSCVGPQQHWLYENQQTFVRWKMADELAVKIPVTVTAKVEIGELDDIFQEDQAAKDAREEEAMQTDASAKDDGQPSTPSTPKNDTTALPPITPKTVVPGQPRKTPGKSRHCVAAPETAPEEQTAPVSPRKKRGEALADEDDPSAETVEEDEAEMMISGAASAAGGTDDEADEGARTDGMEIEPMVLPPPLPPKTTSKASDGLGRSTLASKGKGKAAAPSASGVGQRTLKTIPVPDNGSSRSSSSSTTTTSKPRAGARNGAAPGPPGSPTRLPQRSGAAGGGTIPQKRRSGGGSATAALPAAPTAPLPAQTPGRLGRMFKSTRTDATKAEEPAAGGKRLKRATTAPGASTAAKKVGA